MKIKLTLLTTVILSMILVGCGKDDTIYGELEPIDGSTQEIKFNGINLFDSPQIKEYSEYKGAIDTEKYFNALANDNNAYFIIEDGGQKYLLVRYNFYGYGSKISKIKNVEKKYDNGELTITIDADISYYETMGDEPDISSFDCSFLLDSDVSTVKIGMENMEQDYYPYEGGIVIQDEKYGVLDANLNEIVPVEYELIMRWGYNPTETAFYHTRKDDANGLMDEDFNIVLSNSYSNIVIITENKFLAMLDNEDSDGNCEIVVLDADENIIGQGLWGFIDANTLVDNPQHQLVFGKFANNQFYEGVVNDELNIIIEPVYKDIVEYSDHDGQIYYVVQNDNDEFAVFDINGVKKTEYEKTSAYEVSEKYYNKLLGPIK